MSALRQVITTKTQMTVLRDTVRSTFSAGQSASFLSGIVTDVDIINRLNKAIGTQKDKPLKTRQADSITASMLGFNNANEMHAFYDKQRYFLRNQYIHKYDSDSDIYDVFVEEGVEFSVLDAIALLHIGIQLDEHELFDWSSTDSHPVTMENIPDSFSFVSKTDNLSGVIFDLMPCHFNSDMHYPKAFDGGLDTILDRIEQCVDYAGNGRSFAYDDSDEMHLNRYMRDEFEVFSFPQAAMSSKAEFIAYYSNLLINFGKEENLFHGSPTLPNELNVSDSGWISLDYDGDYEVFYDIKRALIFISVNRQPLIGAGIHITNSDVRGEAIRQLAE